MKLNPTDHVRQILASAREEAIRLRHDYVGTEHLLLGIVRGGDGSKSAAILAALSADPDEIRTLIEQEVRSGTSPVVQGELPYTSRAKVALENGLSESREMGHSFYGSEHLLLGLLGEKKGIAAEILNRVGVTLDAARRETLKLFGISPDSAEPVTGPREGFDEVVVVHLTNGEVHRVTETRGPSAREFAESIGRRGVWITGDETFFVPLTSISRIHVYTPEEWSRRRP